MISFLPGLLAGAAHVLAGPDHLAAVAPLSVEARQRGWGTGVRWGIGHSVGVLLLGVLSLASREFLPIDVISGWSERIVGIVLIGVGFWGLRRAFRNQVHAHEHTHDGSTHVHYHVHAPGTVDESTHHGQAHDHSHAAFAIGMLHGSAGGAHFFGVLPALAFPTLTQAALYVIAYGIGTIGAMAGFAWALGAVGRRFSLQKGPAYQCMTVTCAVFALGTGIFWLAR